MNKKFINYLSLAIGTLFLTACHYDGESRVNILSNKAPVEIQVETVYEEVDKERGLMGREFLPDGHGMLFVYNTATRPVMWMKGMLIPLDIIFIGDDFMIKHIEHNLPPCLFADDSLCPRYASTFPSTYILELPAGYAQKQGVSEGDKVELLDVPGF